MKNIKKILVLSTLAMMFASCGDKEEYTPGGPENGNPYDVYFVQPKTTSFSLAPEDPTDLVFTARRNDSTAAITVPVELIANNDASNGIFTKSDLTFPAGIGTTTVKVSFPGMSAGISYSATLEISDPEYVHIYSDRTRSITFTVSKIKWNTIGTGIYVDNVLLEGFSYEVEVQQNDANDNEYRLVNPYATALKNGDAKPGSANGSPYVYFNIINKGSTYGGVSITASGLVGFEMFQTGCDYSGSWLPKSGSMSYAHPKSFSSLRTMENYEYSKVLAWKEDNTPGVIQLAPLCGPGGSYYGTQKNDGLILFTFPGYVPVDYTVTVEQNGYSENGKVPVKFSFGTDIVKLRYVVRENLMSDVAAGKLAETLKDDATAVDVNTQETLTLDLGETGIYTIVAAGYDKDGVMQGFGQGQVKYVKAGDDKGVVLTGGLFVSDKFASDPTMTSKNSVQVYIYGADITAANFTVVKTSEYLEKEAEIKKALAGKSVKSTVLDAINGDGYSTVVNELESGTSYTLLIRATNGYAEKYVTYEATTK